MAHPSTSDTPSPPPLSSKGATLGRIWRSTLVIGYATPVLFLVWFIFKYGVNVPFGDQWDLIPLFEKVYEGSATFQDFFAQHNEHRVLFPKLIMVLLAFASGWNVHLEMFVGASIAVATLGLVLAVASRDGSPPALFNVTGILCAGFMLSISQWENWLWGFQIAWFLTNFCLLLAIALITIPQGVAVPMRLLLAGLACLVASFSSAHGLFSWVALVPVVVALPGSVRQRAMRALLWAAVFFVVAAIYLSGYEKPVHHPSLTTFLSSPNLAVSYFLTLLGNVVGPPAISARISGLVLLINFMAFSVYWVLHLKRSIALSMAPWLAIGWFTVCFSAITTIGRSGFGVEQAASSRYISVSVLLLVALIQLWRVLLSENMKRVVGVSGSLAASGLILLLMLGSGPAMASARWWYVTRVEGQACLDLIGLLSPEAVDSNTSCLKRLYPSDRRVVDLSLVLAKIKFRQRSELSKSAFLPNPEATYGYIDLPRAADHRVTIPFHGPLVIGGWAAFPNDMRQPEAVVLTYDEDPVVVTVAAVHIERSDVAKALGSSRFGDSGWEATLQPERGYAGERVLKAWAFDRDGERLLQLRGEPQLSVHP
jgi:hypothetical protein